MFALCSGALFKAKLRATALHFVFTFCIGALSASVIFFIWYPSPYTSISGGMGLWRILIIVELVLGPLMSLVIYNPAKSIKQLMVDYSLVALVQVGALAYGVHMLYDVRPVFLVFVKDRFELATVSDFGKSWSEARLLRKGWVGPTVVGVRVPETREEREELLFDAVESGKDVHLRPKFYTSLDKSALLAASKPLSDLMARLESTKYEGYNTQLSKYDAEHRWVPIVNGFNFWVAILGPSLDVEQLLPVDSWELRDK